MNAITESQLDALKPAHEKLKAARSRAAITQAALEKAQAWQKKKAEPIKALKAEAEEAHTKPTIKAATEALASAELDLLVAYRDLKVKQAAHDAAMAALRTAEDARHRMADLLVDEEAESIAAQIQHHVSKAIELGEMLKSYNMSTVSTPINLMREASSTVKAALDAVPVRQLGLNTPINTRFDSPSVVITDMRSKRRKDLLEELEASGNAGLKAIPAPMSGRGLATAHGYAPAVTTRTESGGQDHATQIRLRMLDSLISMGSLTTGIKPRRTDDMTISRNDIRAMLDDFKELKAREERKDRRTGDVLLTCPTPAEWAAYAKTTARVDSGRVWTGMEAALDALEPDVRSKVLENLDAYKAKDRRKTGDAASEFMGRTARDMATGIAAINAAGRTFWDNRSR